MDGADATGPVVAEETVKYGGRVEGRGHEAADVGDEEGGRGGGGGVGYRAAREWLRLLLLLLAGGCYCCRCQGVRGRVFLVGELDVHKGGDGLDVTAVLGMLKEVALARPELGVPFEDVELILLKWLFVKGGKSESMGIALLLLEVGEQGQEEEEEGNNLHE